MSKGVVYVTASDEYLYEEAVSSAESVRAAMPDLDIAVVTDTDDTPAILGTTVEVDELEGGFGD